MHRASGVRDGVPRGSVRVRAAPIAVRAGTARLKLIADSSQLDFCQPNRQEISAAVFATSRLIAGNLSVTRNAGPARVTAAKA